MVEKARRKAQQVGPRAHKRGTEEEQRARQGRRSSCKALQREIVNTHQHIPQHKGNTAAARARRPAERWHCQTDGLAACAEASQMIASRVIVSVHAQERPHQLHIILFERGPFEESKLRHLLRTRHLPVQELFHGRRTLLQEGLHGTPIRKHSAPTECVSPPRGARRLRTSSAFWLGALLADGFKAG